MRIEKAAPSQTEIDRSGPKSHVPAGMVREGNRYVDRWVVGWIFLRHELKRWLHSLCRQNRKGGQEACSRIMEAYLTSASCLDLSSLDLPTLPGQCLSLLQNLNNLDLRGNKLRHLRGSALRKLADRLNFLDLRGNPMAFQPEISYLYNLEALGFPESAEITPIHARGTIVHRSTMLFYATKETSLKKGELKALNNMLDQVCNDAPTLDLSGLRLRHIPPQIRFCSKVKNLILCNNMLTSLSELQHLPNLESVTATGNLLSDQSQLVFQMKNVRFVLDKLSIPHKKRAPAAGKGRRSMAIFRRQPCRNSEVQLTPQNIVLGPTKTSKSLAKVATPSPSSEKLAAPAPQQQAGTVMGGMGIRRAIASTATALNMVGSSSKRSAPAGHQSVRHKRLAWPLVEKLSHSMAALRNVQNGLWVRSDHPEAPASTLEALDMPNVEVVRKYLKLGAVASLCT